jgi:hypothetical protein
MVEAIIICVVLFAFVRFVVRLASGIVSTFPTLAAFVLLFFVLRALIGA